MPENNGLEQQARAEIRPIKERVEDQLIAQPGVVAVDIGHKVSKGKTTGELSIVVYVTKKKPKSSLAADELIPAKIDGIATDVKELTIELQAMVRLEDGAQVDPSPYPTLVGGIGIGPVRSVYLTPPAVPTAGNYVFVGTLGALVRDRGSGATMALTNFHVACIDSGWHVGDRMVQPSLVDGGSAATQQFGSLTRATLSGEVDGALITLDAGKLWDASVQGIGDINGSAAATVGLAVQKRGRTTEHTFGSVASTDFTVTIDYGDGLGSRTLRHQIRINTDTSRSARFSDHGDSGSTVLDGSRNVVGLLFAGSNDGSMTFANPIASVLSELNIELLLPTRYVPPVVSRSPLLCPSRIPVLCPTRSPLVCYSRTVICQFTRPILCHQTRTPVCYVVNSRPTCPPPLVSRAICGGGDPFNPRGPIENPGIFGPGQQAGSQYSSGEFDDDPTYWAGYLAAVEDLASEQDDTNEQDQV